MTRRRETKKEPPLPKISPFWLGEYARTIMGYGSQAYGPMQPRRSIVEMHLEQNRAMVEETAPHRFYELEMQRRARQREGLSYFEQAFQPAYTCTRPHPAEESSQGFLDRVFGIFKKEAK